ncbi:hypothetical protein ATX68_15895 [Oenococcus oeni]|nr:hypothetical protein ATX68_15895 [Oenococcus oeni]
MKIKVLKRSFKYGFFITTLLTILDATKHLLFDYEGIHDTYSLLLKNNAVWVFIISIFSLYLLLVLLATVVIYLFFNFTHQLLFRRSR